MIARDLVERFYELFRRNEKLSAVKEFKELTGLGLREAKEFIDNSWDTSIGDKVKKYLFKQNGYIGGVVEGYGVLTIDIQIAENIQESQVDELIELLTIRIAELKAKK